MPITMPNSRVQAWGGLRSVDTGRHGRMTALSGCANVQWEDFRPGPCTRRLGTGYTRRKCMYVELENLAPFGRAEQAETFFRPTSVRTPCSVQILECFTRND